MRRTWLRASGAIAATQLAAACGFQLRQAAQFQFSTLYAGFAPGSLTHVEFRRQMRVNQGVALVDRPEDAEVHLQVLQEFREKETVSFSSTGRPREYQLRLHFAFRLAERDGDELIPPTQLLLRREITTTDDQLVAKEQEEAYLFRRMHADLAEQLVMRLAAVRR